MSRSGGNNGSSSNSDDKDAGRSLYLVRDIDGHIHDNHFLHDGECNTKASTTILEFIKESNSSKSSSSHEDIASTVGGKIVTGIAGYKPTRANSSSSKLPPPLDLNNYDSQSAIISDEEESGRRAESMPAMPFKPPVASLPIAIPGSFPTTVSEHDEERDLFDVSPPDSINKGSSYPRRNSINNNSEDDTQVVDRDDVEEILDDEVQEIFQFDDEDPSTGVSNAVIDDKGSNGRKR